MLGREGATARLTLALVGMPARGPAADLQWRPPSAVTKIGERGVELRHVVGSFPKVPEM